MNIKKILPIVAVSAFCASCVMYAVGGAFVNVLSSAILAVLCVLLCDENESTIELIKDWGKSRGITGRAGSGTVEMQLGKLQEEFDELKLAIHECDQCETADAIGDMTVVLVMIAELRGLEYEECVESAYEVISKRTGRMINGTYVKDAK